MIQVLHEHLNMLFRIIHTANFNVAIQGLQLLYHIQAANIDTHTPSIVSIQLDGAMYVLCIVTYIILSRAVNTCSCSRIVIYIFSPVPATVTATTNQTALADRFYRVLYEKLFAPEIRSSHKQAMFLNLLYKSLKTDRNDTRVAAFVKRLLQVLF